MSGYAGVNGTAAVVGRDGGLSQGGAGGDGLRAGDASSPLHPASTRGMVGSVGRTREATMAKVHGQPCWYELSTSAGNLEAAETFYGEVLGWTLPGRRHGGLRLPSRDLGRRHGGRAHGDAAGRGRDAAVLDDLFRRRRCRQGGGGHQGGRRHGAPRAGGHSRDRPLRGRRRSAGRGLRHPAAGADGGRRRRQRLRPAEGRARQLERADVERPGSRLRLLLGPLRLAEVAGASTWARWGPIRSSPTTARTSAA